MQLIHGDCLIEMANIPNHSIDLILCDLPYGTTACKWDAVIPFEPLWENYWRVLKPNGAVVLFGSEPFSSHLRMSQINHFKYDWIWEKSKCSNFVQARFQPLRSHEMISIFSKANAVYTSNSQNMNYFPVMQEGKPYNKGIEKRNNLETLHKTSLSGHVLANKTGDRFPRSIQYFVTAESEGKYHPTQKPVKLLEYLIKTYTNENETVLDNCMGSGSTGIACINTNRNFIGIEKDDKYFEIAKNRISTAHSC